MKTSKWFLALAAAVLAATFMARALAADSNQVTLTGTMVCGKCKLHITQECQDVLQVQKDGKTVNYFLIQNPLAKDFHPKICQNDGEKVIVTGVAKEYHGKEWLTATKIEEVK